jgi:hypothetical protein
VLNVSRPFGRGTTAVMFWVIAKLVHNGRFLLAKKQLFSLFSKERRRLKRTKVLKSEERFNISRFKAGIKSLAAKAALPLQKGEKDKEVNYEKQKRLHVN